LIVADMVRLLSRACIRSLTAHKIS
jgi:hypothetical protein